MLRPYGAQSLRCFAALSRGLHSAVKTKKNIHFEFSQDLVREPLLYQINRSFDVVVNIRGASVSDEGGFIALELEGEEEELQRVMDYLLGQGVKLGEGLGGEAGSGGS
ncbi:MAG: ABC-type methionine transport system ATPase subunit [Planctomycetota bacterium]|jgi:ABC-type methionine transport system ATPase subunit